jgi:glycosyltransferase involved in cell wall biosynthesis
MSKKVALVYDAIYPFIKGGGERRFYELGRHLVKQGYEVHLYGMKLWDGPKVIEYDGLILHGISKSLPLYAPSGRRSISQALRFGLSAFKLLFADFDVIDCCGFPYFSLFPCKLAALIKRKPLFATWHEVWGKKYWNDYLGKVLGPLGYGVELLATKTPDCIVACSQHTADLLQKNFNAKNVAVLPNGIDMQVISQLEAAEEDADIMYAGRLIDFKNLDMVIQAMALLKKEGVLLRFKVIGEGPAKSDLKRFAKKLGVGEQISWLGFFEKSEDVYAHMKSTKTFVLASQREGFGIVAIEANACGTPVVTANFASNAATGLIEEGVNGYVFEPNAVDLAKTLKKVIKNKQKLEESSINIAKRYTWEELAPQQAEVYAL